MKDSGCGVIGTYNALYLLGKDPSLAEVGRRYEISGAMAGGGAWGTNPYGAPQVLKQYGVQYEEYTDPGRPGARDGRRRCDDRFDLEPKGYDF